MRSAPRRAILCTVIAAALGAASDSHAVRIDPDGLGQALIFPYYTVQTAGGSPQNTYLSVVNHTPLAKAVRVRFREGRMGAEAFAFNLFLSPNDVWTGALVPFGDGTRLLTTDHTCTDGLHAGATAADPSFADFRNAAFSGSNDDGAGTGLDRTREGFVEVIEMAALSGTSAAAITHTSAGAPANCAAVQGFVSLAVNAPSGGLSGSVTLINVANGMEFPLNAVALADLSTHPFYRQASDPYPDFNAAEIDPVSVVVAGGLLYRSVWERPVDAVSAAMMGQALVGDYVLDDATLSNTDVVVTFPTREFYVSPTSAVPPFSHRSRWAPTCGFQEGIGDERVTITISDRDLGSQTVGTNDFGAPNVPPSTVCASTVVFDVTNSSARTAPAAATHVLGSLVRGYGSAGRLPGFSNGSFRLSFVDFAAIPPAGLKSLPSSTRLQLATGVLTTGSHTFSGLPAVGFTARTFSNGTLVCGAGRCQGNYGGAFALRHVPIILPREAR